MDKYSKCDTVLAKVGYCAHGSVRKGHGLELTLDLNELDGFVGLKHSINREKTFHLDFAGNIYSSMAIPGSESLAAWFLPLEMHTRNLKTLDTGRKISFTLGAKRLSRQTLMKVLQNLKNDGDPLFSLDVIFEDSRRRKVIRAVTCATKMLNSLENGSNAVLNKDSTLGDRRIEYEQLICEADNRRDPKFGCLSLMRVFRYIFFPGVFGCFSWYLVWYYDSFPAETPPFSGSVPRLIRFGISKENRSATTLYGHRVTAPGIEFELAPLPKSRSIAFQLGAIWQQLRGTSSTLLAHEKEKLFSSASALLDRPKSYIKSVDQLTTLLDNLKYEDNTDTVSMAQRVYGLFSTVNLIWLLSILGIAVTIGPSIYYVLKPFREFLLRSWRSLLEKVLEPLARRCHNYGIFEIFSWTFCAWMCLDARRYYGRDAGCYIGITGGSFSMLAFLYTMGRHGGKLSKLLRFKSHERVDMLYKFSLRFAAWGGIPLALLFESDFLGYVAVFGVFATLGFFGYAGRFCFVMGFDDRNALIRCQFASIILLSATIGLHAMESSLVALLQPLQKAICVFGALVLYISLLITSSKWYKEEMSPTYFVRNAFMAGTLLVFHYFGNTFHMTGLQNTTMVFTVLYLWSKSAEVSAELKLSTWLFALFTSCLLWRVSLYLHVHPGLITSMFTSL